MTIPLSTTTIKVERNGFVTATYGKPGLTYNQPGFLYGAAELERDAWDVPAAASVIAQGVRATLSQPKGSEARSGSSQELVTWHLDCDVVDLDHDDFVVDESTGERYSVVWAKKRTGLGLDRIEAGLQQVSGRVEIGSTRV